MLLSLPEELLVEIVERLAHKPLLHRHLLPELEPQHPATGLLSLSTVNRQLPNFVHQ